MYHFQGGLSYHRCCRRHEINIFLAHFSLLSIPFALLISQIDGLFHFTFAFFSINFSFHTAAMELMREKLLCAYVVCSPLLFLTKKKHPEKEPKSYMPEGARFYQSITETNLPCKRHLRKPFNTICCCLLPCCLCYYYTLPSWSHTNSFIQ